MNDTVIENGARKPCILVVDDMRANVEILSRIVTRLGYDVETAENGVQALAIMEKRKPELVLLDIEMPEMDGYEVLERVVQDPALKRIPIIVVTGLSDADDVIKALSLGAYDHVVKPFNPTILNARIEAVLKRKELADIEEYYGQMATRQIQSLEGRLLEHIKALDAAKHTLIFAMTKLTEYRDEETGRHLLRIREYCRCLGEAVMKKSEFSAVMDEQFVETLYQASPLHDIGKVGVPDSILLKPGRLTPEEFELIKPHTTIGADTLRAVLKEYPGNRLFLQGVEICESHHENWDGSGYPHGKGGAAIPICARILSICDVYDALRSKRPYKDPFDHEKSVGIIMEQEGIKFDPAILLVFAGVTGMFERIAIELSDV